MKKYILTLFVISPVFSFSQFHMDYTYVFNSPLAGMPTLSNSHGFGFAAYAPVKKSNFMVGMMFKTGIYGYHSEPLIFTDSEGNEVNTNLNISNGFHSYQLYGKYAFNQFEGRIKPFFNLGAGWSFFRTRFIIEDPNDVSNCEPLEQDIIQKDNNWVAFGGAGFDLQLTGLFHPEREDSFVKSFFTFSIGYNLGGNINYMNMNKDDQSYIAHQSCAGNLDDGKTGFYTTWQNTNTKMEHEHLTGFIYTSRIALMELKAGFSIRF